MKRRLAHILIILVSAVASVAADAGDVIEVQFDLSLTAAEIDAELPTLFVDTAPPQSDYAVDIYFVEYETTALDGSATPSRAQLFVPRLPSASEVPLYLFAPGSTGLVEACRPSREHVIGVDWGRYRIHALAHAGQGSIVVMPDYMNFWVSGEIQPYYVSRAEAHVLLDAVRSARAVLANSDHSAQPASGAFLAGYSQGGHAVFAAADLHAEYAPEVEIAGIIGYGPSTNVENLFREWTVAAPLVTYAYAGLYGRDRFDPSVILQDRWLEGLEHDVTTQCIGAIQRYYPLEPEPLYRQEFTDALLGGRLAEEYPRISELMELNNAGLSGHGLPVLILGGTDDIVVFPDSQADFAAALCERGSAVRYRVFEGARHDTRQIGFSEAVQWMHARIAGEPAPTNCERYR
ncbi:MAG: lipase family protein [Spirochaetota bacterium]